MLHVQRDNVGLDVGLQCVLLQCLAKTWKLPKVLDIDGASDASLPAGTAAQAHLGAATSHGAEYVGRGRFAVVRRCNGGKLRVIVIPLLLNHVPPGRVSVKCVQVVINVEAILSWESPRGNVRR